AGSRLLALTRDGLAHRQFPELKTLLRPGDMLVFNDTRVIPARLFGKKDSGGRVEVLIERLTGTHAARAHVRASKAPKPGTGLEFEDVVCSIMVAHHGDLFELLFQGEAPLLDILLRIGHVTLPPYIYRPDDEQGLSRYQIV